MLSRLLFFIAVFPFPIFAQTDFGVKGGLNVSDVVMTNYINPDVESDLMLKMGLHAGFFISGMVNDDFGVAAELLYTDKGVKAITNIHLHYFAAPLLIQYKLKENIFAEMGPEISYLFAARSRHGNVSSTYNNKVDLSLDAGIRINVTRYLFGLRYCSGLFSVRDTGDNFGAPANEKLKYQNRVLQFSIGWRLYYKE